MNWQKHLLLILQLQHKTWKTDYMEVGCHRGMMVNEDITEGSNSYEKRENLQIFRLFIEKNENSVQEEIKCRRTSSRHDCK